MSKTKKFLWSYTLLRDTFAAGMLIIITVSPRYTEANSLSNWLQQPTMTGDWGGVRTSLYQEGINLSGTFQTQTADVVSGGEKHGTDVNTQTYVAADFDLQKLLGLQGAVFHFSLTDRAGQNASNLTGTKSTTDSNFGEGENFRLSNMTYEQKLLSGRLNFQIGYWPDAQEFDYSPLLCGFLNNGFCGHPNSLGGDSSGFQNPPGASWGGRVTGYVMPNLYIKVGAWDVNPTLFSNNNEGFKLGLVNSTGVILLSEVGYTSSLGPQNLPGHYKIGGYYDTSAVPDVANAHININGRYSGWLEFDQMVYGIGTSGERGLILFFNITDDDKRTSLIGNYFSTGFVFQGPLAARPNDVLSFGWAQSDLNHGKLASEIAMSPHLTFYDAEEYLEASYKIQIRRGFL
jgi:porin